jgi:TRAP-type uncharacterized transport system substrate-binding protein
VLKPDPHGQRSSRPPWRMMPRFEDFRRLHPAFEALSVARMAHATGRAPLHAGAVRYYREHEWLP